MVCGVSGVSGGVIRVMRLKGGRGVCVGLEACGGDGVDVMGGGVMLVVVGGVFVVVVGWLSVRMRESVRWVVCVNGWVWMFR